MNEEDAPCDVCRSSEVEPDNKIIFCDMCDVAVHQICYGLEEIPSGSWLCKTCENDIKPTCIFCQQQNGAMKNTVDGRWAHVSCTLWIPETNFATPETMDVIQNVERIPKSRWNLSCFICRVKGGACIQCYVPTCKTAYHVTCGYNNGLHMKMEDIVTSESEIIFQSFCRKHTQKMLSLGKHKKKNKKSEDKNFAQFHPNTVSIDFTTKAQRDNKFRSYLEELKEGMPPNLEHNITNVNVISEELEEIVEPKSPISTSKNASGSENLGKINLKDVKVKEEKVEFCFNLSNNSTNESNGNEEVTVENVTGQSRGHNENGDQLLVNNKVSKRSYIGTFLVGKATARKSCASPNDVQLTMQDKVQRIILDKSKGTMGNKVREITPNKVQGTMHNKAQGIVLKKGQEAIRNTVQGEKPNNNAKKMQQLRDILPKKAPKGRKPPYKLQPKAKGAKPKNPPKRKVNSATNGLKKSPANSTKLGEPAESNLTFNHFTVNPQNVSPQNNDQKLPYLDQPVGMFRKQSPYLGAQSSSSMEISTLMQNLPSPAATISNSSNLNAFLGYLGSLLQSLPMKKSLKVQKKLIAQVLKEHSVSSSDDISDVYISDESSFSD